MTLGVLVALDDLLVRHLDEGIAIAYLAVFTTWCMRFGGPSELTEAQRQIIRRIASMSVWCRAKRRRWPMATRSTSIASSAPRTV